MKQIALDIGIHPGPSLQNYLPGPNLDAYQHLCLWSGNTVRSPVPTYLWGESGSGKSYLLNAVANQLQSQGISVGWLDAGLHEPPAFQASWQVLIMDDVHLFTAIQQHAAFNWFVNAATVEPNQPQPWVLAAGALPPADLKLRDDLRSRLAWGHVFQLRILDESQRRAVLNQYAHSKGLFLKDDVMDFILNRFSRDLSHLVSLIDQLDGYALQTQRPITIPLVKSMMEES
jgi:DnaA-homolog protein